jgi:hypothetical protein
MADTLTIAGRREVLLGLGAKPATADEIIARSQGDRWWPGGGIELGPLPVPDDPMIEAWTDYADRAATDGVWPVLRDTLVQLRFPIRAGISGEAGYRAATLKGEPPPAPGGLELADTTGLSLDLHRSVAGTIPVLGVEQRSDFVALVRALTARNEPVPVPDAMGACLVNGLNNWDRIRRWKRRWDALDPGDRKAATWTDEFRRLIAQPKLYKDRLVILSRGPYSGVAAEHTGLSDDDWRRRSFGIRLEHECTHMLTLQVFGALRHDVLEELVADWVGMVGSGIGYRVDLARRFLGVENFPTFRSGGRLEVYRGEPPVSDAAFEVLQRLAVGAIATLDELAGNRSLPLDDAGTLARLTVALLTLPLEAMVGDGAAVRVRRRLDTLEQALTAARPPSPN